MVSLEQCMILFWESGLFCSYIDIDQMADIVQESEVGLPSQLSSHISDASMFTSSSESSYNSDQGSGNEDGHDANYVIYEESSDEVEIDLVTPSLSLSWKLWNLTICKGWFFCIGILEFMLASKIV